MKQIRWLQFRRINMLYKRHIEVAFNNLSRPLPAQHLCLMSPSVPLILADIFSMRPPDDVDVNWRFLLLRALPSVGVFALWNPL